MTIEEMRKKIDEFCNDQDDCGVCPYDGNVFCDNFNHHTERDDIIKEWYELFFGTEHTAEVPGADPYPAADESHIKDSGERQEFSTGAVRDIQKGKGRCDLMPLDLVSDMFMIQFGRDCHQQIIFGQLFMFTDSGDCMHLHDALGVAAGAMFGDPQTMLLEVSKHFEEGAEKYGENNWQKGLPVKCYINSAVRHYLKWSRGDNDEPHDRAFCWNILCAIWTCKHKPELNEYGLKACPVCDTIIPEGENECPNCRVYVGEQKNTCIKCGKPIPEKWKYCDTCWENEHGGN